MMASRVCCWAIVLALIAGWGCAVEPGAPSRLQFDVHALPSLPRGVGGALSGMVDNTLVLAGGTYFAQPPPAPKHWIDSVIALAPGAKAWVEAGRLDHPLAYGASVSTPHGIVLVGGCDAERHFDAVNLLTLVDGRVHLTAFPSLPQPVAYLDGCLLGKQIYVAGGRSGPQTPEALRTFWRLDLDRLTDGWRELEPWPGPARIFPRVVSQDGAVYVFSGAELTHGGDGQSARRYLTDGYRYHPQLGWRRLPDLPRPVVAAPVTAWGAHRVLVFGGDDGSLAASGTALGDAHPGFSRAVLSYDTQADRWTTLQKLSMLPVTASAQLRGESIVIASGEDRPGHRTCAVHAFQSCRGTVER